MAAFLTKETRAEVVRRLKKLRDPVRLLYFTQSQACGACAGQRGLLEELAALSDKLTLEVSDFVADADKAHAYGVDKVPATVVPIDGGRGLRFFGLTGGYELVSLLEAILMVSTGHSGLDPAIEMLARRIREPVHLEIMVTLTCPYCPRMVQFAHQLAFAVKDIQADMIDAAEFPTLVQRYQVQGVPLTVINERRGFEGALPAESAMMEILKRVDPDTYEQIETAAREARGERQARAARPGALYDVIVVGAGPAGLTAALYATRKGRQVLLIGKKAGGQVNDTALVENYPGFVRIAGTELAQALRHHAEAYPVAERCHTFVTTVRRANGVFEVVTENDQTYRGRCLIYAAGKQYRRLGVPGEERFLGHGVGFCATCDAPLYAGKRVAVVGGGNSAFTAVRDLLPFAREIHLIHMLDGFQADPVLVEEVERSPKVKFHLKTAVRAFLGDLALSGARIVARDGAQRYDLAVEGVFLEIGLVPNTGPLKGLVTLNGAGEVPVLREQTTDVPGLFAAGDVTDETDKQIVIAAGGGARAALAAERYLAAARPAAVSV
ncbi:MAG: FAD-dependent oxidoreductase [Gammaproteobacteria bacterium]|nr:FAD-dependent oxidoreductase [Gammaproteobacteria bacterium]